MEGSSSTTTTLTVPTITPTTAALDYGQSQNFTATATATTTTNIIPEHNNFTIGTTTYYYYNGSIYTSTNDFTQQSITYPDIAYSWTLTGAANDYLSPTSGTGSSITITHSPQTPTDLNSTLSVTASAEGQTQTSTSNATVTAKASTVDPTSVSITSSNPMTLYVGNTGNITYSLSPTPCYNNVTFTSANTSIATVSSTGEVTSVATGQTTISVKAYKYSDPSSYVEATVTVNVRNKVATPVITFTPSRAGETATTTITCATSGATIYYKVNSGEYAAYSTSFTVNENDVVQAYAVMTGGDAEWWDDSDVATATYVSCTTDDPVITCNNSSATITAETGATIYYTTDGSDPTTTNYGGSGTTSVTISDLSNGQVVKAIAKNGGCSDSGVVSVTMVVSGISGSQVILYDFEDHNWSYYNAAPDTDYYPSDVLLSPDPRNVKITYRGGSVAGASAVAVSTTEPQNEFVYYKTIEKLAWGNSTGRWLQGNYAYRTIPNPFSKRPRTNNTTGTNGLWGFNGWKVLDGGDYIQEYGDGQTIPADQLIHFVGLPAGNNGSGEIVLEAQWTEASVVTTNSNITGNLNGMNGTSYETNFIVYTDNGTHTVTGLTKEATISSNYPNGEPAGSNGSATISNFTTSTAAVKLEYIKIGDGNPPTHPTDPWVTYSVDAGAGTFQAQAGQLIVGRGCVGTVNQVNSGGGGGKYSFRIESGKYTYMFPMQGGGGANNGNYGRIVLGCDYDRAADDGIDGNGTGDNTKLRVVNYCSLDGGGATGSGTSELMDITVKSGYYGFSANKSLAQTPAGGSGYDGFGLGIGGNTDNYYANSGVGDVYTTKDADNNDFTYHLGQNSNSSDNTWRRLMSFYVGPTRGAAKEGVNRMLVEGGEFNNINGGGTNPGGQNLIGYHFRMKGGWVKGAIYGTASISNTVGSRKLVITGGEVNGWVAGGCNGTDFSYGDGKNEGICYIYAGGDAELRSHYGYGTYIYNNAYGLVFNVPGGQIFGAGRGLAPTTAGNVRYCGSTTTAYVVVADEAKVEQNVYGGGYNGVSINSYVYILGGTVGKKVFGGTARAVAADPNDWWCNNTVVRMYGGTVKGGIYGGHDETGVQFGNAEVTIYGGTVGDQEALTNPDLKAFVHGGGYGDKTVTRGNVNVTIGAAQAGPTIFGDVYGGSALGNTNATATFTINSYPPTPQTVSVTNLNYYNGTNTDVTLNTGAVHGNVYGGALGQKNGVNGATSDIEAFVFGPVNVTANGGYAINVFGCNNINGRPRLAVDVFIKGGTIAENVFGGGNMADYIGNPTVTVSGGLVMQHVFGGGFAAEVDGNTFVLVKDRAKIFRNVYGGGNKGVVTGDTQVIVNGELAE